MADDAIDPVTPWAQVMRLVVLSLLYQISSLTTDGHRKREQSSSRVYPSSSSRPAMEPERLIKQTYSVHVSLPADRPRRIIRKWHLSKRLS
jgi:hypothetical protein